MPGVSIGKAASITGLSIDTLRYYEKIGLLRKVARDSGGRRRYDADDLSNVQFIQRAQRCNFSLAQINQLFRLGKAKDIDRSQVQRLTEQKLTEIKLQQADLDHLQRELQSLLNRCRNSEKGCPIIEGLNTASADV